jgi:hypothetical protein
MLDSRQPMFIAWGPDQNWLYNDALVPIAGRKHPACLGLPASEVWAEAWTDLNPHSPDDIGVARSRKSIQT